MARVILEGVSKSFAGDVAAVRQLNFEIPDGEFLVVVGPSGCGKSTTLRMLAGLESPSSGRIWIGEREVTQVAPRERDVAMVFQNYALYPHMTVYKNMAFGLELRCGGGFFTRLMRRLRDPGLAADLKSKRQSIRSQVEQAASLLGIKDLLDRMPRQLSGGERQRVALGRAIVRKPAVFLFDEPLSNLDARLRLEMRKELKRLHRELKTTAVYVTHDQSEAMTLGQRVAVMSQGEVQQVGTPLEIYDHPRNQFVAAFVGTPPMNFLSGMIVERKQKLVFERPGFCLVLDESQLVGERDQRLASRVGQQVVLGVRPERVRLAKSEDETVAKGSVTLIESLGDSSVTSLRLIETRDTESSENELVSKVAGRADYTTGETVEIAIDREHVHLFAPDTGENITYSERT